MLPFNWESEVAALSITSDGVLRLLDFHSYFELTEQIAPESRDEILTRLATVRLIKQDEGVGWNILNLGAMLFAHDVREFGGSLARKGVRVIRYDGNDRTARVTHRHDELKGYANGFEGLLNYINGLIPQNERIGEVFRQAHPLFPALSVRELVANALIHQDMTVGGSGPLVELFLDRIEISNPGSPLIETNRMVDHPPRSRNEELAHLMRRMKMCEELGSGLDKVFAEVEFLHLPAPLLKASETAMQVVMYGPRSFAEMSQDDRVRACYWHTVLKYVSGDRMKNSTLRERLGIDARNAAQVSRVIRDALDENLIKVADTGHPKAGYHPAWA